MRFVNTGKEYAADEIGILKLSQVKQDTLSAGNVGYVDTLAKNTSTSEDLMRRFLEERPDVHVFKDGDRWAASLTSRSSPKRKS